jgi:hypothetical protein
VRGARVVLAVIVVAASPLVATAIGRVELSLARLTDKATTPASFSTDTLDPPTSLSATGGTNVALAWTATADTYAAGYAVLRGTVSGGPYSVVKSVTPRTVVVTTDSPASNGTYYYVLRSTFQNWTSASSNQASAVVSLPTILTGFKACTAASNAADTGGDGNGYESNPGNACAADGAIATDVNTGTNTTVSCTDAGKDRHRFWDFNLGVPASASAIAGIQVRADVGLNNNAGTTWLCVQLSWDAGATWTAAKQVDLTSVGVTTVDLGAANDTWGRSWAATNFSNANFGLRVIDASDRTNKDVRLDYLAVQVSYTP